MSPTRIPAVSIMAVFLSACFCVVPGQAQHGLSEMDQLKEEIQKLKTAFRQELEEKERRIEALEKQLKELQDKGQEKSAVASAASELDKALQEAKAASPQTPRTDSGDIFSKQIGGATLRLMDISLDGLFAVGTSTERDESLQSLQGGGHDPRKRGFTIQNVELSFAGAVDPYFNAEAHIVYVLDPLTGESIVELEEAFLTTQSLPFGLQFKGGHYLTEFGLINPIHPHAWHWLDQPIINTRLFGPDGMRAPGGRIGWLIPVPWFSELYLGVQNANGETMASFLANEEFFEERPIGGLAFSGREVRNLGDLLYSGRLENAWDLGKEWTVKWGLSAAHGPNASGLSGETWIYGTDLKVKWRPAKNERGWPFLLWQSELMGRDYRVDRSNPNFITRHLRDWGFYTQVLYGFRLNWAGGLRYEYAGGSGESFGHRNNDPFRDNRHRISPLLLWQITEFSRLRLQYNYDVAKHLSQNDAHSVWFGFEFMFGAHPAHKY